MESSPPRASTEVPNVAGKKRPASLLPAFDPSSSPPLPRPLKRVARESDVDISTYPTPVPTSSTAILSSSPPRVQNARPGFRRTNSMVSERAPLSAVASIMLSESGETISMGRSSASCDYQLSANRLISRVHVQATYKPATTPFGRDRIEILCSGWNGIKLHCQGKTYELTKGKTFTSDIRDADVMIDVQDARVLVQWPRPERKDSAANSDHTWDENSSPTKSRQAASRRHSTNSSPLRSRRPVSPVSPSPAVQSLAPSGNPLLTPSRSSQAAVVVYEDEPSPTREQRPDDPSVSQITQLASNPMNDSQANSMSSSISKAEELSEHDEENDPVVHSFSENVLSGIPSFRAGGGSLASSTRKSSSKATTSPKQKEIKGDQPSKEKVSNHVANQLAFSRLSSTPLSTILSNLPPTLWKKTSSATSGFTSSEIRSIIESTPCIGVVNREGKDAAGKPLESEYYYVPDFDEDTMRKEAVVHDLRKPGLRNCRKQHKQYFWRKPK